MPLLKLKQKQWVYLVMISFAVLFVVQLVWLRDSVRLKEKDFDEKVKSTLRFFNNDFQNSEALTRHMRTVWNDHDTMPRLQGIIRYSVDTCFQRNGLPTDYVMGLGLMRKGIFWYENPSQARKLDSSSFSIIALCMGEQGALELKFAFPSKQRHIMSSLMPILLLSGFGFLVLLLGFLSFAYLLRKQAKLAELKNDFINNMTHELKTPLFTVSLASRLLAKPEDGNTAKRSKYIHSIQQEVKRLDSLIDKILLSSQLEQKRVRFETRTVDLHEVVSTARKHFELLRAETGGDIQLNLLAGNFFIKGDEAHLVSSVCNLMDNAFKYTKRQPQIVITTKSQGGSVSLSVRDNGVGFDSETKDLIFERFFRAHTGNLHTVRGHGIGLSYVKSVVDSHGGSITVNSKLGSGSEFTLHFPLIKHA